MKTLYIIGNGFDRAHELETSYVHFHEWLRNHKKNYSDASDFVDSIEGLTNGVNLWRDFENALGSINSVEYLKRLIADCKSEQENENWIAQSDAVYADLEFIIRTQYNQLIDAFCDWARDIDTDGVELEYVGLNNEDNYFFTFNYTDTLENIYHIPNERIMHIHGYAREKGSKIIVGHSKDYRLDRNALMALLDAELPADGGDSVDKLIEILNETCKDADGIIHSQTQYFQELSQQNIRKIIVIGHSYGEVDWPYFNKIKAICPNAKWELQWFSCKDYQNAKKLCQQLSPSFAKFVQASKEPCQVCKCWEAIKVFFRKKCCK